MNLKELYKFKYGDLLHVTFEGDPDNWRLVELVKTYYNMEAHAHYIKFHYGMTSYIFHIDFITGAKLASIAEIMLHKLQKEPPPYENSAGLPSATI